MVFVEELLYFIGFRVLKDDFGMRVIGVLIDKDGMMVDEFENLIIEYLNKLRFVIDKKLYFLMLYCVFIFNNLIGFCFVLERCEKLMLIIEVMLFLMVRFLKCWFLVCELVGWKFLRK